ncbi:MAG: hypothetical protein MJ066_05475 [Clostridia bacterium]|nr:hypothetical protein [Clostridia bacterium]
MAYYDNEKINKKVLLNVAYQVIERAVKDAKKKDYVTHKDKTSAINFIKRLDESIYWDVLDLDGAQWENIKKRAGIK